MADKVEPGKQIIEPAAKPDAKRRIEQRLTVVRVHPIPGQTFEGHSQLGVPFPVVRKRSYIGLILFALCVVLPISVAVVYFGFIASDQYDTEFRFSVRDTSNPAAASALSGGLMSLLGGGSGVASPSENYMVTDFVTSRQAVDELERRIDVIKLYSRPSIEWWSRFSPTRPIEDFVDYWSGMVTARYDLITGIATVNVRAFTPQDSLLISKTLIALCEELVNRIDRRSQNDAVKFAQQEVDAAQARLKEVRAKLTAYRNKFGIIDPATSVVASNSTLVQGLRSSLAQLETQLTTLQSRNLSPNAPAVLGLKAQIQSAKEQLARTEAEVDRSASGSPLSKVVGDFEQLNLDLQFAQAMVTSTMQSLEQARATAMSQHLYIEPYVRPSLPHSPTYPRRLFSIVIVSLLAFGAWIIVSVTVRSITERFG